MAARHHRRHGGKRSHGLFLMVAMAITGDGFFRPLELIGSIWYGAFTTGTTVILGGACHPLAVAGLLAPYGHTHSRTL